MIQRVRIGGRVLLRNFPKIHSQDSPSFLYASKRCSSRADHRFCLFVLERPCSASQESLLSLLKSGSPSLKSSLSPLLDGSTFSDTEAPTSIKQSASSPVQERPAPVRGRFLNFVEQRTRMDPSLRLGRAAKMYSHERPSVHIWASFTSSSIHDTLLFFDFNGA